MSTLGWVQLVIGLASLVATLGASGFAFALENQLTEPCRTSGLCGAGERQGVQDAWTVAAASGGASIVFTTLGAVYLWLGDNTGTGAPSLPPDLDPGNSQRYSAALAF